MLPFSGEEVCSNFAPHVENEFTVHHFPFLRPHLKKIPSEPPDISFSVKAYELIGQVEVAILGIDGIVKKTKFGPSLIKKFHGESSQECRNRPGDFIRMYIVTGKGIGKCLPRCRRRRNARGRKRRDWGESSTSETGYIPSKKEGNGEKSACGSACEGDRISEGECRDRWKRHRPTRL